MVQKIQDDSFSKRELPLEPFILIEDINEIVNKSLSHLQIWSDAAQKWLKLRGDDTGKLFVSGVSPATKIKFNAISATTVEASTPNPEPYTSHLIINDGTDKVYLNFDATATTSDFPLEAGESLNIDLEFTTLHYLAASGTQALRWLATK